MKVQKSKPKQPEEINTPKPPADKKDLGTRLANLPPHLRPADCFIELCRKYPEMFYPMFPFRQGQDTALSLKASTEQPLVSARIPLTNKQLKLIHKTVGSYDLNRIKAFLHRSYSGLDVTPLTWDEILAYLEELNQRRGKMAAETEGPKRGKDNEVANIKPDDDEQNIIFELSGASKLMRQREIARKAKIREGTVKDKLPRLEKLGLADRPKGPRSGYAITDKGKAYIEYIENTPPTLSTQKRP